MKRTWQTRIVAIATIGAVEFWALYLGYNGLLLATSLAAIAGIAGYDLGIKQAARLARGDD